MWLFDELADRLGKPFVYAVLSVTIFWVWWDIARTAFRWAGF